MKAMNKLGLLLLASGCLLLANCSGPSKTQKRKSLTDSVGQSEDAFGETEVIQHQGYLPPNVGTDEENAADPANVAIEENKAIEPKNVFSKTGETLTLSNVKQQGTAKRFLGALALTKVYSRVFEETKQNGEWFDCGGRDQKICIVSMFNPGEANALGELEYTYKMSSVEHEKEFKMNYLRSLRAGVSRQCNRLIDVEWAEDDLTGNQLVKSKKSVAADGVHDFMLTLLNLPLNIKFEFPSQTYADSFNAIVVKAEKDQEEEVAKSAYKSLCLYLATDPLIIMY